MGNLLMASLVVSLVGFGFVLGMTLSVRDGAAWMAFRNLVIGIFVSTFGSIMVVARHHPQVGAGTPYWLLVGGRIYAAFWCCVTALMMLRAMRKARAAVEAP